MREKCCCFTGHRSIPEGLTEQLQKRLRDGVDYLYEHCGISVFYAGGALGFDSLAAEAVIDRKRQHPDICLVIVMPCRDQTKRWNAEDVARYESINSAADKVICLSEHYYRGCMHQRNRYMVDHSCACICYLTKATGGTAYTVKYAQGKDLRIFNLAREKAR